MIDTVEKLESLLPALKAATWIAVDTEADSLHAYPEKLCLLQISAEGVDALIDPLANIDLYPLLEVLRNHELIMHGADYDLRLLRKTFDFVPTSIFDTMLAARLLGCREFGLSNLVSSHLDVKLEKGPQKADWARRPLTVRMEEYARNDTRFLRPLSEMLRQQLHEEGRLKWHQETCARLIVDCAVFKAPDPETVWRVKGCHHLSPAALAVVREIWHWREHEAIDANKPPYFILQPDSIVALAVAAVEGKSVHAHLPRRFSPRRESGLLKAVQHGLRATEKPQPLRTVHYRQSAEEKRRYHDLEKRRNRRATELGIDPTIIASRGTLVQLSKNGDLHAESDDLMLWQRDLLK